LMPSAEWLAFCDQLDEALQPITSYRLVVRSVLVLGYLIVSTLLLLVLGVNSKIQSTISTLEYHYFLAGFVGTIGAISVVGMGALVLRWRVRKQIQTLCRNQHKKTPDFLFEPHFNTSWRLLVLKNKWSIGISFTTSSKRLHEFDGRKPPIPSEIDCSGHGETQTEDSDCDSYGSQNDDSDSIDVAV